MLLVVCKCGTDSNIQPSALDNDDKWLPLARVLPVPTVCDTGVRKEKEWEESAKMAGSKWDTWVQRNVRPSAVCRNYKGMAPLSRASQGHTIFVSPTKPNHISMYPLEIFLVKNQKVPEGSTV